MNEAILRHPAFGMLYFEADPEVGVSQVHFEYLGNCNRASVRSGRPGYVAKEWVHPRSAIVGEPIQR